MQVVFPLYKKGEHLTPDLGGGKGINMGGIFTSAGPGAIGGGDSTVGGIGGLA